MTILKIFRLHKPSKTTVAAVCIMTINIITHYVIIIKDRLRNLSEKDELKKNLFFFAYTQINISENPIFGGVNFTFVLENF